MLPKSNQSLNVTKKFQKNWRKFGKIFKKKNGSIATKYSFNLFIFRILAKCRTKKTLLSRIAMNPQRKLRNKKENNK